MTSLDEIIKELSRCFQLLGDSTSTRFQKKRALEQLFDRSKSASDLLTIDDFLLFLSHSISYLVLLFHDVTESNREKSLQIVEFYVDFYLNFSAQNNKIIFPSKPLNVLINSINQIFGQDKCLEPSEEIRLLFIQLLYKILSINNIQHHVYLEEYTSIFVNALQDSFHEVKKCASKCLVILAKSTVGYFHNNSTKFIHVLLLNLSHQHSRVRSETVIAISNVIQCGDNKSVGEVCSHLAQRLFDDSPIVREEIIKTVGFWLLELPDRYSFHHKLIPLLLTGTFDDITSVADNASNLWYDIGLKYEMENEEELKDKQNFGLATPKHYPVDKERPNLGCRVLIFRNLSKIITPLSKDILDWVADTRVKSARLLAVLVLNAEDCITQHLEILLSCSYKAALDEEHGVREGVKHALVYAGYFVDVPIWWKLLRPVIVKADSQLQSALFVLSALVQGTDPAVFPLQIDDIVNSVLVLDDVCFNYSVNVRLVQLDCITAIIDKLSSTDLESVTGNLYYILMSIMALHSSNVEQQSIDVISDRVRHLILTLCDKLSQSSVLQLHRSYFPFVLLKFKNYNDWTKHCPQRVLLDCLCLEVGPVVGEFVTQLIPIFQSCLMVNRDVELRLKLFVLLAKLVSQANTTINSTGDFEQHVPVVIDDMVFPNCLWQAGRTAEAIRKVAATCLWALLQGLGDSVSNSLTNIRSDYLNVLGSLLDDDNVDTRLLASKSLLRFFQVAGGCSDKDILHKFYPTLLRRLDDSSDEVRCFSCSLLCEWFDILKDDFDQSLYASHYEELYRTLLIHLDDQESSVQSSVLTVLTLSGPMHPVKLKEEIERVRARYRSEHLLNELEQVIMPALMKQQVSTTE